MNIIQSQAGQVSAFTLASQPDDASVLALFVNNHTSALPVGCASKWTKIAGAPFFTVEEWRGVGPFDGTQVNVVPGRTPPTVDALIMEIG